MQWETVLYQNTLEAWTRSIVLAAALWAGLVMIKRLLSSHFVRVGERKHDPIYETVSQLIHRTKVLVLLLVSLVAAARPLTLPGAIDRTLERLLVLGLVLQFGLWGGAFLRLWLEPYLSRRIGSETGQDNTVAAVSFLLRFVFYSLLVIWGLDNLGVNVSALVTGLGVGGVAVALATQNILGDLFASLSITLDQPFQKGDTINVGDLTGTVEKIGLKTTRVRSITGEQLIFSNTDLLASRIRNYRRMEERRVLLRIGVLYETKRESLPKIPDLLKSAAEKEGAKLRFDRAHLAGLGPSSIDYEMVFFVLDPDYKVFMDYQQRVLLSIVDSFAKMGVEFAYPTQTIHLHSASPSST